MRGIIILVPPPEDDLDETEVLAGTLASACAIALGREPELQLRDAYMAAAQDLSQRDGEKRLVMAFRSDVLPTRLARAVSAEADVRGNGEPLRAGTHIVALMSCSRAGALAFFRGVRDRLAPDVVTAGISRPFAGAAELERALDEASEARQFAPPGECRTFDEVELTLILRSLPRRAAFLQERLGPLLAPDGAAPELRETLGVYLASGRNATEAARRLKLHRNTLAYRLKRIEAMLRVSLDNADEAFALDLALRTLRSTQSDDA
jgi:hypothetical protein